MTVLVALEFRFHGTADGRVYTDSSFARPFWDRYLEVFDEVAVMARVLPVAAPEPGAVRADGGSVRFVPLPHYVGPWEYLLRLRELRRAVRFALDGPLIDAAVILRVPGAVSDLVHAEVARRGRAFAVEVVGDPADSLGRGAVRNFLRPLFRARAVRMLRRQCATATCAAYVTRASLQRRYPCGAQMVGVSDVEITGDRIVPQPRAWTTSFSSIELRESDLVASARRPAPVQVLRVVTVGSLEQPYKGTDLLLDAVRICIDRGLSLCVRIVGGGRLKDPLEARARRLGLGDAVRFVGKVPAGDPVRAILDESDLFVLPSLTEGLPRAMIEAMARGVPCIGSDVGGIPELLPDEDRFPPGDAVRLASKIVEVAGDAERMHRMSERGLETARDYLDTVIGRRRASFYTAVRDAGTALDAKSVSDPGARREVSRS